MTRHKGRRISIALVSVSLALFAGCSQGAGDARRDQPGTRTTTPPDAGKATTMTPNDHPGGTGVDEHGNLLRGKPENQPPLPSYPAELLEDHDAHLLFHAGGASNDQALMKKVWTQLGLANAAGAPYDKLGGFMAAHQVWIKANPERVQAVGSATKANAYLSSHLR